MKNRKNTSEDNTQQINRQSLAKLIFGNCTPHSISHQNYLTLNTNEKKERNKKEGKKESMKVNKRKNVSLNESQNKTQEIINTRRKQERIKESKKKESMTRTNTYIKIFSLQE